ncbi:sugar transporter domain-containing protein [Ditylenchus destructor]|uniref:Sugar transporter domain-containing protein n=1 Tax=Ditylenchus destructor TaxID=166010 RepID=A0AAD4MG01_9BILA|nr:sugar transporter domain-containing protein [Ditylenchus destructor]
MMVTLVLCILFMLISSFASSLIWFTVWRFCANVANAGMIVIWNVFFIENLPTKDRFWIKSIIAWSPNMAFYAIIAYIAGDWRTLTRTSALLAIPALVLLTFLCESPRWLLQRGKLGYVKTAIMRIHRIDGRLCDVQLLDYILYKEGQRFLESRKKNKYSFIHLFYTRTFAGYTIAVSFSIFVTSVMLYSLVFNMEKLSGSLYWNNIIMGLLQYACNLVTGFVDFKFERIGRKSIHDVAQLVSSVALAVCTLVYLSGYQVALSNLVRASTLCVLGMCSLLYTTNVLCTNELFPTCIRNVSFSFVQTWSRIGVVVSPLIFFLGDLWTPSPYLFMCILTLTDLLLFRFNVTETKGKPLSDNMPENDQQISHDTKSGDRNVELLPLKNGNDDGTLKQDK